MRSILNDYDFRLKRITDELAAIRTAESQGKSQGTLGGLAYPRVNEAISELLGKAYIYGAPTEGKGGRRDRLGDPRQLGGPNTPFKERTTPKTMANNNDNR